jgi:hypothetical protein
MFIIITLYEFTNKFCLILGESAKSKWKNLRDTSRREFQKLQQGKRSGESGGTKMSSTWPISKICSSYQMR